VSPRSLLDSPGAGWLKVVGRLKQELPRDAAQADATLVYQHFIDDLAVLAPPEEIRRRRDQPVVLGSAAAGLSGPRREFEGPVLLLMAAVALVLLIACANVINLLFARGIARHAEINVRLALGASRARLVRQLLTESALLGLFGGALGLAFAVWGTPGIAALMANEDPAIAYDVAPDRAVIIFTLLLSLGSALAGGVIPAFRTSRVRAPSLRGDSGSGGRWSTLWARWLIVSQVALSLLLLVGTLLLLTTLRNFRSGDFGFEREGVVTMSLSPGRVGYTGERRVAYLRDVLQRVRNMPGVQSAAVALGLPMMSTGVTSSFVVEGQQKNPEDAVFVNEVSEGYFATTGTKLMMGRDFGPDDRPGSTSVAIVSEALARRYFGSKNPIGRRIDVGIRGVLEIVGVVETTKHESLRETNSPIVYAHALQGGNLGPSVHLAVKATGDALAIGQTIRRELQRVAPVPVGPPSTLSAQIDRTLVKERLVARVLGAFAILALLLSAAGLYGVLAYSVARRTAEIGVRMALGATRRTVLWPVIGQSMRLAALGLVIGIPSALALTRLLSSLLYGVTPTDPSVLATAVLSLLFVAAAAGAVPARRASRVDPLVALRSE
jgi:predicted permease